MLSSTTTLRVTSFASKVTPGHVKRYPVAAEAAGASTRPDVNWNVGAPVDGDTLGVMETKAVALQEAVTVLESDSVGVAVTVALVVVVNVELIVLDAVADGDALPDTLADTVKDVVRVAVTEPLPLLVTVDVFVAVVELDSDADAVQLMDPLRAGVWLRECDFDGLRLSVTVLDTVRDRVGVAAEDRLADPPAFPAPFPRLADVDRLPDRVCDVVFVVDREGSGVLVGVLGRSSPSERLLERCRDDERLSEAARVVERDADVLLEVDLVAEGVLEGERL